MSKRPPPKPTPMAAAVRCNLCLEIFIMRPVAPKSCPYCGDAQSLSMKPCFFPMDDAIEEFGHQERMTGR